MSFHSLMFGWEYPPHHSGGLGVACQGLVRGLLKHGNEITLVLPMMTDSDQSNLNMIGPESERHTIRFIKSSLQPYEGFEEYAQRMREQGHGPIDYLYGPNLGEAVEQYASMSVEATLNVNPDVIHCHDWMTYDAGIRAAKHHRVPLVAHMHATELDRTDFKPNQWIADKERHGLMKADKVIAVSNYTKTLLVNQYGIPADKIAVVHNGHDSPHAHRQPIVGTRTPLVLFLGRLTTQKNPWQFLEAAKLVHDQRPDTQFVMAGEGPMYRELIDQACTLGLSDSIVFTGKVSGREADALYRNASCFVMPSLSEPFGLVALEAIGHGVPVVLSKQSGAAEVIEHCFKVDFWDTERFADCIITVLREQPLAEQLRAEAPRVLQRLTWQNQAAQVQNIYRDLIQ
jgi:glycosyltransferase involved in cell wall biosynthesis